jgi:hypothetical protein
MTGTKKPTEDTLFDYVTRFFLSIASSGVFYLIFKLKIPGLVIFSGMMLGFSCLSVIGFAWQLFFHFCPLAIEKAPEKYKGKLVACVVISSAALPLDYFLSKSHSFGYIVDHIDFGWASLLVALFVGYICREVTKSCIERNNLKHQISPFLIAIAFFAVLGFMSANNMHSLSCDNGDEASCTDEPSEVSAISPADNAVEHYIGYILASFIGIGLALRKNDRMR